MVLAGRIEAALCCPKVEFRFPVEDLAAKALERWTAPIDPQLVEIALADAQVTGRLLRGQEEIVLPIGRAGERGALTLLRSDDSSGCITFHVESSETDLGFHSEF